MKETFHVCARTRLNPTHVHSTSPQVKDRSSEYYKESNVRSTGSYIYEEFMPTDGIDVKVYAVGVDYAHAEARKSAVRGGEHREALIGVTLYTFLLFPPSLQALDGHVERDESGKEKRFPVLLTAAEKLIARKVVLAFKVRGEG